MNNGPSWQPVQGCGARLKKQQITRLQGHQGGAGARLERWGEGLPTDTQERRVTEGAPLGALGPESLGRAQLSKGKELGLPAPASLPSLWLPVCSDPPKGRCRFSGPSTGMLKLPPRLGAGTRRDHHATRGTPHTPSLSLTSIPHIRLEPGESEEPCGETRPRS